MRAHGGCLRIALTHGWLYFEPLGYGSSAGANKIPLSLPPGLQIPLSLPPMGSPSPELHFFLFITSGPPPPPELVLLNKGPKPSIHSRYHPRGATSRTDLMGVNTMIFRRKPSPIAHICKGEELAAHT